MVQADREGRLAATDLEVLAQAAWFTARPDLALEARERAFQAYVRAGNKARAGLLQQGGLLIGGGRTNEGFPLLEEATVAAVSGELNPFVAGVAYCSMIASCRDITDYRRASEWTEVTHRWCERQSINGFPGICRVHRAEIVALQGALDRAEQELLQATTELAAYDATPPLADGFYALGEIRFRLGDLVGAEDALRQAHSLGRIPQPALALMRLSEGKVTAEYGAIRSALAETADRWARARMLPAQIEIAIAAGDPATARASAEELGEISAAYDSPALRASKHDGWGRVRLAEGDAEGAVRELHSAIVDWQDVGAPYEVARDRGLLATALQRLGRDDEADLELRAEKEEFHRLGAALAIAHKTFMFTDIFAAPTVRIGLHSAVATRRGSDYSGKEVHVAARIAALASGGEILASAATAALADSHTATDSRVVSLKGVSGEVEVISIPWN